MTAHLFEATPDTWRIGLVTIYLSDMADIGMFAMLHLYFL